jgi:hypothetical protein
VAADARKPPQPFSVASVPARLHFALGAKMKWFRYFLVFLGFLGLEAMLCVLLPRIRSSGVSMSACMWIAFYVPVVLVFCIFSILVFRDAPRRGLSRLVDATAGGFVASFLWFAIVFFVGIKITGAGSLMAVQENAQPVAAPNERQ